MRKLLTVLLILPALLSFYMLVLRQEGSLVLWLLISNGPVMAAAAVLLFFRSSLILTVLTPTMLFYSLGAFMVYEPSSEHVFAYFSAGVMGLAAVYVLFRQMKKLRILRTAVRLAAGALLLGALLIARGYLAAREDVRGIAGLESRLFFDR